MKTGLLRTFGLPSQKLAIERRISFGESCAYREQWHEEITCNKVASRGTERGYAADDPDNEECVIDSVTRVQIEEWGMQRPGVLNNVRGTERG